MKLPFNIQSKRTDLQERAIRNDTSNGFNIHGTWPLSTWRYLNNKTKRGLKRAEKITDEQKKAKSLANAMNISGNDSWIYRLHQWYVYLIHSRYTKLIKKYNLYKKSTWEID